MADPISAAILAFQSFAIKTATAATLAITGSGAAAIVASNFVAGMVTLGAAGGGLAATLGTAAGFSAISSALSPKPQVNATATQLQTKVGAVTPRAIIMGRTAVAGTLLTPTPLKSGKDDRFASNFYALSHAGPSGVVESIIWGDDVVTFDGSGNAIGKYNDNMWLFQRNGDWNQTAISYSGHPVLGSSTPSAWDSTKRARGCLTVALVVRYAAKVLGGNMQTPIFVVDANAVALTDPRTGSPATTQAQRRNPAVWAYSWRLGWFQNSKRVIGMGQASGELHAAGYAYAANVADANGWTISGEATTADDRYAVESAMLLAAASVPVERNGLQSVVTSALRSSVGTITSNDLRADPKWRYNTQQSSRPTAIQTRYRSETNRWQMVEGAEVTDASWLTQDAGREKRVTVEYAYAGGGSAHVGHLAALDASNAREPLIFSLPCKQQARYAGFVGDAVTVSLPEIGLSSTKMVVVSRVVNADGTVDYELLVETDAKYAFAAGKTSAAPSFTLQPGFDIFSVPQPGAAEWASVAAQITSGATSLPIVRVTGSAADYSFCTGVVFKIRLNSGGSPWLVSEDAPPAATQHEFRGLTNATSYIVGVAYRGVTGIEGPVRELAAVTTGVMVSASTGAVAPGAVRVGTDIFPGSGMTPLPGTQLLNDFARDSKNLSRFSGFVGAQLNGWSAINDTGGGTLGSGVNIPGQWAGPENYMYLTVSGSPNTSQRIIASQPNQLAADVEPGQRLFCPVHVAGDRTERIRLEVRWISAAGTTLGYSDVQTLAIGSYNRNIGGASCDRRSNMTRIGEGVFVTVPATVGGQRPVKAAIWISFYGNSEADPYGFVVADMIEVGRADQLVASPYEKGPDNFLLADVTAANTAAGFAGQGNRATTNIYRQSSAPTSPGEGDIWEDTSTSPVSIRRRISGAWVFQAEEAADVTAGNVAAGFIGQGNQAGTNIYRQSTAPSSPNENDIWEDTSVTPNLIKRRVGGVWIVQSEEGADITALSQRAIVPQFPIIEIKQGEAGHTGNRTVTHTVFAGASSISGGTFSLPAQNLGAGSASVNSSTGTVTLSGIVQSGSYTIRYTHTDGRPTDLAVNVTYFPTPPTASNGKIAVDSSANGIASGTYSEVLSLSLVGAPTGVAEVTASYEPTGASGTSTDFQLRLTRAGAMIAEGTSFNGIDGTGLVTADWASEVAQFQGFYSAASGTATWAIEARRTSGSGSITTATGQLVVNQQPT